MLMVLWYFIVSYKTARPGKLVNDKVLVVTWQIFHLGYTISADRGSQMYLKVPLINGSLMRRRYSKVQHSNSTNSPVTSLRPLFFRGLTCLFSGRPACLLVNEQVRTAPYSTVLYCAVNPVRPCFHASHHPTIHTLPFIHSYLTLRGYYFVYPYPYPYPNPLHCHNYNSNLYSYLYSSYSYPYSVNIISEQDIPMPWHCHPWHCDRYPDLARILANSNPIQAPMPR